MIFHGFDSVSEQKLNPSAVLDALKAYDKTLRTQNELKYMGAASVEDLTSGEGGDRKSAKRKTEEEKSLESKSTDVQEKTASVPDICVEDAFLPDVPGSKKQLDEPKKAEAKDEEPPPVLPVKQKVYGQVKLQNLSLLQCSLYVVRVCETSAHKETWSAHQFSFQ